ncbi:Protein IQ-DOMAIN 31 [Dichanthelium oligosanthes]|uniref:Protein IQ-DOMAIN 31 n=1 Tax=Dichanthelium oligosanthes TaxID=888268 RepID=A0A1E5WE61_9POAL|nr:Protein IQ-DOMAIN 31 [Dichanthelium oligosanthes]
MGKSPAKWIKSVLFGKKSSSRSGSTKAKDLSKGASNKGDAGKEPAFSESSPVISEPVLVSAHNNETVREVAKGDNSSVQGEVAVPDVNEDLEKHVSVGSDASNDAERLREEQAAVKAQAAFRGYLARRAFRALKGIIRLQALIRGHLVRRQAVSTLRATWLIVKFQALIRGRNVRLSQAAIHASWKLNQQNFGVISSLIIVYSMDAKPDSWKEKLSSNAFAHKLLSSPIVVEALHFQYDEMDPNSAFNWLERWTISHVWKPISQPKRVGADAKSHARKASYAMETESAKLKRNARKSSATPFEPSQTNTSIEIEKTKRHPRKLSSAPADSVPDGQLTELEKVKRSLRKVTNSMAETSKVSNPAPEIPNHQEVQCERPIKSGKQVPVPVHAENQEPQNANIFDNAKMDIPVPDLQADEEIASDPVTNEEKVDEPSVVAPPTEIMPLQDINSEENALVNDMEQRSKEEPLSTESLKGSKRRSSFSTKPEYPENGSKNSPSLPSYMAATQSAKAKLRGQNSPRLSSDSAEKNGFTRRHSLPSSTNGKMVSHSPRTQRPTHASGKDGVKGDKAMLSSRDASGK